MSSFDASSSGLNLSCRLEVIVAEGILANNVFTTVAGPIQPVESLFCGVRINSTKSPTANSKASPLVRALEMYGHTAHAQVKSFCTGDRDHNNPTKIKSWMTLGISPPWTLKIHKSSISESSVCIFDTLFNSDNNSSRSGRIFKDFVSKVHQHLLEFFNFMNFWKCG